MIFFKIYGAKLCFLFVPTKNRQWEVMESKINIKK